MSISANKKIILNFFEAGASGDLDTCFALLADDVTWTNIGSTRFSGTYHGKQELIEELIGPLFAELKNGIATRVESLLGESDIVVAQAQGSAESLDGKPYNNSYCHVFRLRNGKILEVKEPLINYARARRGLCGVPRLGFGKRGLVIPNKRAETRRGARKGP